MSALTESAKESTLDLLRQLENEISNLFHTIEDDKSIPENDFRMYETRINKLFSIHKEIYDNIYFS